ncbi:MAG: hypothetical protein GY863_22020, partial [bacterium]|nr:hypothetical protein [bacterium]
MKLFDSAVFRKYLLPGFVFQSVVIAGGYGTGREIVEYFLNYGPLGGLLGMILIATVIWSLTLALSFEFARLFKAYDYRSFFKVLLGKYWFLFEIIYLYGMLLILAVVGSAAGVLIRDNFGVDYIAGVIIMFIVVGLLTFKGSRSIEKFLAGWSFILYAVYAVILVVTLTHFGPVIKDSFLTYEAKPGWLMGGFKYALYNINVIPAVMFCLTHIETRKEAVTA